MAPLLDVRGVTLQYNTPERQVTATYRVNFDVAEGDRFVILGPSGCGKSTILKAIGGFIQPVEGTIELNGRRISAPGPERMMVFQDFEQLMPWKTVLDNVLFAMKVTRRFKAKEARKQALSAIDKVKLSKFAAAYPHTLSGGMKMRVAIARALAMKPDILLMDEPFAALDALTRRQMQGELRALWEEVGFTVVFVTHSIEEAIIIGSRILVLSPHPGQVRAELGTSGLERADVGSAEFSRLSGRIHQLLFDEHALAGTSE